MNILKLTLKIIALAIVLFLLFGFAGAMLRPSPEPVQTESAVAAGILILVCLLNTLVVAVLILSSIWSGWRLAGGILVVNFGIVTFMSQIESAVFPTDLPEGMVWRLMLMGLLISAPFSLISVAVFGKWRSAEEKVPESSAGITVMGWIWRLAAISLIYLAVYFLFGYFVAWQFEAVREYYGGPDPQGFISHMASLITNATWLIPFQIGRALIWAFLGLLIVRMTGNRGMISVLSVGLAFSVLMTSQLLLPNPFMPEAVRMAHLLETATSNFLFGLIVGWLFTFQGGFGAQR